MHANSLFSGVRQQRDGTGALDGLRQLTLMLGAVAAHAARHDLAALVDVAAHTGVHITELLVIDVLDLVNTERTNLAARLAATRTACSTIFRHGKVSFHRRAVRLISQIKSIKREVRRRPPA